MNPKDLVVKLAVPVSPATAAISMGFGLKKKIPAFAGMTDDR
jgi:hypothetical protein